MSIEDPTKHLSCPYHHHLSTALPVPDHPEQIIMCHNICLQYYCQTCGEKTGSQVVPSLCNNHQCTGVPPGERKTQFQAVPRTCTECLRKANVEKGGNQSGNVKVSPEASSTVTININTSSVTKKSFDGPRPVVRGLRRRPRARA